MGLSCGGFFWFCCLGLYVCELVWLFGMCGYGFACFCGFVC